jgi:hypothetical protein
MPLARYASPATLPAPTRRVGAAAEGLPPTFRDGSLAFWPTLLTVRLPVGRRIETTRFIPPDTPNLEEALAALDGEGFERTKMHQALAIRNASREFPCRQLSFLVRGETFYAPDQSGVVRNCHAAWDATKQRFELYPTHSYLPRFFTAVTKVEYPG